MLSEHIILGNRLLIASLCCIAHKYLYHPNQTTLRLKALLGILELCRIRPSVAPLDVRLIPIDYKTKEDVELRAKLLEAIDMEAKMVGFLEPEINQNFDLYRTMFLTSLYLALMKLKERYVRFGNPKKFHFKPNKYECQLLDLNSRDTFGFEEMPDNLMYLVHGHEHAARIFGLSFACCGGVIIDADIDLMMGTCAPQHHADQVKNADQCKKEKEMENCPKPKAKNGKPKPKKIDAKIPVKKPESKVSSALDLLEELYS